MKVLISVDMEGISGVATRRETATGWPPGARKGDDYERARAWMTADTSAAIAGACAAGATEIVVADAHDGMLNLIWEDLDPRASVHRPELCLMWLPPKPGATLDAHGVSRGCPASSSRRSEPPGPRRSASARTWIPVRTGSSAGREPCDRDAARSPVARTRPAATARTP